VTHPARRAGNAREGCRAFGAGVRGTPRPYRAGNEVPTVSDRWSRLPLQRRAPCGGQACLTRRAVRPGKPTLFPQIPAWIDAARAGAPLTPGPLSRAVRERGCRAERDGGEGCQPGAVSWPVDPRASRRGRARHASPLRRWRGRGGAATAAGVRGVHAGKAPSRPCGTGTGETTYCRDQAPPDPPPGRASEHAHSIMEPVQIDNAPPGATAPLQPSSRRSCAGQSVATGTPECSGRERSARAGGAAPQPTRSAPSILSSLEPLAHPSAGRPVGWSGHHLRWPCHPALQVGANRLLNGRSRHRVAPSVPVEKEIARFRSGCRHPHAGPRHPNAR